MRRLGIGISLFTLTALACGPSGTQCPDNAADAGSPDFQCAGVAPVTLTKLQTDVLTPSCASNGGVSCHSAGGTSPTDYSSVAKSAANVGLASPGYGAPLKVVDPNNLLNSTMWLKVLGGSPKYKSPICTSVGPAMPQTGTITSAQQAEIKGWICNGAPAQ